MIKDKFYLVLWGKDETRRFKLDKEKLIKILEDYFGFSDQWHDGTYFYNLNRVKEAFNIGTMTTDDFTEMEYEQIEELADLIIEGFKE